MEVAEIIATIIGSMISLIGVIGALWKYTTTDKFRSYLQVRNKIRARKEMYKGAIKDLSKVYKEAIKSGDPKQIPNVIKELNKLSQAVIKDTKEEINGKT